MTRRVLSETVRKMYYNGLEDENFVMEAVEHSLGGTCEKSTRKQDMYDHIDFWWNSPKKGKIGIDVKGIKKNNRKDDKVDDTINWIEMMNVRGNLGWIYGKSEYIAFRTNTQIVFVKTKKLQEFAEEKTKGKELVNKNPKDFYVPYRRYQRLDIVFKCPTQDLIELADFIIDC